MCFVLTGLRCTDTDNGNVGRNTRSACLSLPPNYGVETLWDTLGPLQPQDPHALQSTCVRFYSAWWTSGRDDFVSRPRWPINSHRFKIGHRTSTYGQGWTCTWQFNGMATTVENKTWCSLVSSASHSTFLKILHRHEATITMSSSFVLMENLPDRWTGYGKGSVRGRNEKALWRQLHKDEHLVGRVWSNWWKTSSVRGIKKAGNRRGFISCK